MMVRTKYNKGGMSLDLLRTNSVPSPYQVRCLHGLYGLYGLQDLLFYLSSWRNIFC